MGGRYPMLFLPLYFVGFFTGIRDWLSQSKNLSYMALITLLKP